MTSRDRALTPSRSSLQLVVGERTPVLVTLAGLVRQLRLSMNRWCERRALLELTDDELRDIGLSRQDVARESARWPWDGSDRP